MTSSTGDLDTATFAWDHHIYRYIFLSGLAILLYDHLLTLGTEIQTMWLSELRPGTLWFLGVRYISLVSSATFLVFIFGDLSPKRYGATLSISFPHSPHSSCETMEWGLEALLLLQESLVEFTLIWRVLAMFRFNLGVGSAMGIAYAAAVGLGLWTVIDYGRPQMLTMPGLTGCHTAIPRDTALRLAGSWLAQLLLDLIVFGLTVYCAYRDRWTIQYLPGSLVKRMARDGALYFGIIVLANLGNILTLFLGDIMIAGILSWWTTSLSLALICRLMLNLRSADAGKSQAENFALMQLADIQVVGEIPRGTHTDDNMGSSTDA